MSFNQEGNPLSNSQENVSQNLTPSGSLPVIEGSTHQEQTNTADTVEHMTAERIVEDVKRLIQASSTPEWERVRRARNWPKFFTDLGEEFRDLRICYPAIFRMVVEMGTRFEMPQLLHFLRLRERMERGQIAEQDAHQQIGQEMVDRYVKPMLDKK